VEVTGGGIKLRNEELKILLSLSLIRQIKLWMMRLLQTVAYMREKAHAYKILKFKPK
jgi:hypothetical protein